LCENDSYERIAKSSSPSFSASLSPSRHLSLLFSVKQAPRHFSSLTNSTYTSLHNSPTSTPRHVEPRRFSLRPPAFEQHKVPDLSGRVYVVTGGSNGIGLSASRTLFTHGAKVIILSSQASIGAEAVAYIKSGKLEDAPKAYREGFGAQTDKFVFFFPLRQAFSDLFSSFSLSVRP
jgi:hypothetical protein